MPLHDPTVRAACAALPPGVRAHVDHVGIAVANLEAALRLWGDLLGLEVERIETVPTEQVRVAMLKLDGAGGHGHLELLAPTGPDGAIARHLARHGPGLHHVAVAVADLAGVMAACAAAGLVLLDAVPRRGAAGRPVAFVHPKSAGGVLLELCGPPDDAATPA
jgi:methylmalonyl-CoA/ethylmalonyl-CoA epimerase